MHRLYNTWMKMCKDERFNHHFISGIYTHFFLSYWKPHKRFDRQHRSAATNDDEDRTTTTDKRTTLYTKAFPDYYYCYSFVDIPLIPIVYIVIHLSRCRCGPHNFSFSFFFLVENINNTQTDTLYYSRVCADIENPSRFFRYFLCWFASASVRSHSHRHTLHTHMWRERDRGRERSHTCLVNWLCVFIGCQQMYKMWFFMQSKMIGETMKWK